MAGSDRSASIHNQLLFSEIFFEQIRRETSDLDNLRATLSTIRDTWRYYLVPPAWAQPGWKPTSPFPPDDVAQLRAKVVEQIFAYLELTYGPCEADSRAFFLYADWTQQERTGLCLVLPYSADIEGRDPKTGFIPKGRNYAQQLMRLLRQHKLDWGVLTNGRHWRLFHRSELSPTETYLHVDLEHILAADDVQSYIVFHRFLSRTAFARQDDRQCLELYKQRSDQATKVIEAHLSAHVEEIVRQLCQGLVESCHCADEEVASEETRREIYRNALYLVYRLLFVLYAEARDLLPLDAAAYRALCLRDLVEEVRDNHKHGLRYDDEYALWERLQALFALIDQGKAEEGVPAYNGGLFDPGRRPFLTRHRIRNEYLQAVLIRLCTMPARGLGYDQDREPRAIDYRDLSVRHLGSLYEGLLEYSLFLVEGEPCVVRAAKKRTEYVPYSQAGKVRAGETVLQVGNVYVSETAEERKATGSYYTPEEVVEYIVSHTVGEKLAEVKAEFNARQQIERQLADLADTPAAIPAHRQIQLALDDQFLRFVREQILDLKILDPAMGSGHFLVNATHAVANFIVESLNETPWENVDLDTDVATWKRRVAERCIFGVDLNELAVELAKLCLWMTTAARGRPLTYLDHHLRWGNSLVGAWLKDVGVYPLAQKVDQAAFTLPLGSFQVALDQVLAGYRDLYAKDSDDVEEVRQKARLFDQEIWPALERYRDLLDLHTSVYFGNGVDEHTYAQAGAAVHDRESWARLRLERLDNLLKECKGHRWFHWDLEFPEVFGAAHRGFDVVVGNPPYVRQERLSTQKGFLLSAFSDVYTGSADLYVFFVAQGITVLAPKGLLGFITADKWIRSDYAAPLRAYLPQQSQLVELLDFGHSDVFPGTDTFPCILIAAGRGSERREELHYADVSDRVRGKVPLREFAPRHGFPVPLAALKRERWLLEASQVSALYRTLQNEFPTLGSRPGVDALFGIKTGFDAAFCLDGPTRDSLIADEPSCKSVILKSLRGRHVRRWKPAWQGDWIITIPSSDDYEWPWSHSKGEHEAEKILHDIYPALHGHLKRFETELRRRQDQGRFWWELRPCAYYDLLRRPKIVVQQILFHSVFALEKEGQLSNAKVYSLTTDELWLLGVLNSRVMWWYMYRSWPHMKDEALAVQKPGLLSLPIPPPPAEMRARIEELIKQAILLADDPSQALLDVEQELNQSVIRAYGLTNADVAVIEQTLPPRDPLVVLEEKLRKKG